MFSYYGSKSKLVNYYPPPKFDRIVEPFAGSARYSLKYYDREIILIDKYSEIIEIWKYLQQASERDVLELPRPKRGMVLSELNLSKPEGLFLGFLYSIGRGKPTKTVSPWAEIHFNGEGRKDKLAAIASQLYKIRHWKFVCGDYACIENAKATWFIDPPYQDKGKSIYVHNSKEINFFDLSNWCRGRNGQVIVCENVGADWLPFQSLTSLHGAQRNSEEAIWTNN
jgi:site-specific DNA-adenine methylase